MSEWFVVSALKIAIASQALRAFLYLFIIFKSTLGEGGYTCMHRPLIPSPPQNGTAGYFQMPANVNERSEGAEKITHTFSFWLLIFKNEGIAKNFIS